MLVHALACIYNWFMDEIKLETFVTVVEEGSFTKAADLLYLSPVAVKKQVDTLERELGCILFDRKPVGCSLTPVGEVFLNNARAILRSMSKAKKEVEQAVISARGEVLIGYNVNLNYRYLGSLSVGFSEIVPGNLIQFQKTDREEMLSMLKNKQINGILSDPLSLPEKTENELEYHRLACLPVYAIMKKDHELAGKAMLHTEELKGRELFVSSIVGEETLKSLSNISDYRLIENTDRNILFNRLLKGAIEIFPNTFDYYCCIPLDFLYAEIGLYTLKNQSEIVRKAIRYIVQYTGEYTEENTIL